ncbi:MAG: four helix bundle protein [Anaerolineae bacterium]|nr:four helix bundle protein [Anaerolineae bacterium]
MVRNFDEWLRTVSEQVSADPLWKIKVYRLALFLGTLVWYDTQKLAANPQTISLANQLFRAVGSVGANIAEGYSRRSDKDRARFYEYALGSAVGLYHTQRTDSQPGRRTSALRYQPAIVPKQCTTAITIRSKVCSAKYALYAPFHPS